MQDQKTHPLIVAFACFYCGLIAACANTPNAKNVIYTCDRGTHLNVNYTQKGFTTVRNGKNGINRYELRNVAANITLADGTLITLAAQKVASGFMFSNAKYTFSGKDNQANWVVGRMLAEQCQISP